MQRGRTAAALLILLTVGNPDAHAAAPDLSYGLNGRVHVNVMSTETDQPPVALFVQNDGRVLAALWGFAVARFLPDGTLDTSYGEGGTNAVHRGLNTDGALAAALQSDGSVVIAGYFDNGLNLDYQVVRFTPGGQIDEDFGSHGRVVQNGLNYDSAHAVAVQADGRIVVAGVSDNVFGVARFLADGGLDGEFFGGTISTPVGNYPNASANAVIVQGDGRILVVGRAFNSGTDDDAALVRYNTNGTLDSTFGNGGKMTTDFGGTDGLADVALYADGRILARLETTSGSKLVRYSSSGVYDGAFGVVDIPNDAVDDFRYSLAVAPDNTVTVVGASAYGGVSISTYAENGSLSSSSLGAGAPQPAQIAGLQVSALAAATNGHVIAGGYSSTEGRLALVSYTPGGDLDSSFGTGGVASAPVGWSEDNATTAIVTSDAKLIVAGNAYTNTSSSAVAVFDSRGRLEAGFPVSGESTEFCAQTTRAVAVGPGRTIVTGGTEGCSAGSAFVARRYSASGVPDATFAGDGQVHFTLGSETNDGTGVVVQADGSVVITGSVSDAGTSDFDFVALRFTSSGQLDTTFGVGPGYTRIDLGDDDNSHASARMPDGRIVLVGDAWNGSNYDFAVARILPDGQIDSSFGGGSGFVTTPIGAGYDQAWAVALQTDGKILVAGDTGGSDYAIVRYLDSGDLDAGFGTGGIVTTNVGAFDTPSAIAVMSDGRILLAGESFGVGPVLLRYDENGAPDTSFGDGGVYVLDLDNVQALTVVPGAVWAVGAAAGDLAVTSVLLDNTGTTNQLVAAVLPTSRSVQVGTPATVFATIINTGDSPAVDCAIAPFVDLGQFLYQTTDAATNLLTGTANTPANIPPGLAQSFLLALTPDAPFPASDVALSFDCANTAPSPVFGELNTLLLSASAVPVPDVIALAATIKGDGVVRAMPAGAFSVATVNVGAGGEITATADTGAFPLPVGLSICETNPTTGQCLGNPAASVVTQMPANATATFAVFPLAADTIDFAPATNRIFVRFRDAGDAIRGATSVAVCQTNCPP